MKQIPHKKTEHAKLEDEKNEAWKCLKNQLKWLASNKASTLRMAYWCYPTTAWSLSSMTYLTPPSFNSSRPELWMLKLTSYYMVHWVIINISEWYYAVSLLLSIIVMELIVLRHQQNGSSSKWSRIINCSKFCISYFTSSKLLVLPWGHIPTVTVTQCLNTI